MVACTRPLVLRLHLPVSPPPAVTILPNYLFEVLAPSTFQFLMPLSFVPFITKAFPPPTQRSIRAFFFSNRRFLREIMLCLHAEPECSLNSKILSKMQDHRMQAWTLPNRPAYGP